MQFLDLHPPHDDFRLQVLHGLSQPQKQIPAKFFYDDVGAKLFEAICDLPEYYLTRTETALMRQHAADMARHLGTGCLLVEFGSGNSRKTPILLRALNLPVYMPVDISKAQLQISATALEKEFPYMLTLAVCADYSRSLELPRLDGEDAKNIKRKAVYFPGSTLGNFSLAETPAFLRGVAEWVGQGGAMLVGIDLKKSTDVLNAAYNDAQGVTAAFNLNLLARINRELGGNFNLENFRHHAFYNEVAGRIEMHLQSMSAQRVNIGENAFDFIEGETIHTENSCKYTLDEFRDLARQGGFNPVAAWTDEQQLFSVHYLEVLSIVPTLCVGTPL